MGEELPGESSPESVSESTYDELGRVTDVSQNGLTLKHITYDSLGRKTQVADAASGVSGSASIGLWKYHYDANGNLIVQEDPAQNRHIQYFYDGLNRVTKKCYMNVDYTAGGAVNCASSQLEEEISYVYDNPTDPHGRGRLHYVIDPAGLTEVVDYDRRGRELSVIRTIDVGSGQAVADFEYVYTNSGEVRAVAYPGDDGEYVVTEFNAVGQPTGLVGYTGWPPVLKDRYVKRVEYNLFGQATLLQHGNGWEAPIAPARFDRSK